MTNLLTTSSAHNPLASVIDPASPLGACEQALSMAALFAGHGRLVEARMALMLSFTALHLAALSSEDMPRLARLSRAAREADAELTEAASLDSAPTLQGWP